MKYDIIEELETTLYKRSYRESYKRIKRMKNLVVKFSTANNEVEKVTTVPSSLAGKRRIDEEGLFGLFTANIIKLKQKFTR